MGKIRQDICVSIGNIGFNEVKRLLPKLSLAEIRIDLLKFSSIELMELFAIHDNLIATYRPKSDEYSMMQNILCHAIESGASWVDVDINTPAEVIDEIATKVKITNSKLIISYHNFTETPNLSVLESIIDETRKRNANLTKISCMANNTADCARILSLYERHSNLLAFCMGQTGSVTRIASPLLGAPFTYAGLQGNQTAPGQIDYISMNNLLNTIKPIP